VRTADPTQLRTTQKFSVKWCKPAVLEEIRYFLVYLTCECLSVTWHCLPQLVQRTGSALQGWTNLRQKQGGSKWFVSSRRQTLALGLIVLSVWRVLEALSPHPKRSACRYDNSHPIPPSSQCADELCKGKNWSVFFISLCIMQVVCVYYNNVAHMMAFVNKVMKFLVLWNSWNFFVGSAATGFSRVTDSYLVQTSPFHCHTWAVQKETSCRSAPVRKKIAKIKKNHLLPIQWKVCAIKTNLMHYLSSVYFVNQPPHVSGILVAHQVYVPIVCIQYISWWWTTNMPETCRGWLTK
jgi:hypothetical protein